MEDLLESLMRDNVAEVKVVLASVALALAVYQLVLPGGTPAVTTRPAARRAPGARASPRR